MSQQRESSVRLEDIELIVDSDAHVMESVDDFSSYIDDEFTRQSIEASGDPKRDLYSSTNASPGVYADSDIQYGDAERPDTESYRRHRTNTTDMKLEEMDKFGIDYSVIQPTLNLSINTVNNPRYAVALANAYNSWIVDSFTDKYEGIKAAAIVAPQDPKQAADEIDDRADEDDIVAVGMASGALLPPMGDEKYDPIYEAAERHGLPILLHGTSGAQQSHFPLLRKHTQTKAEDVAMNHAFQTMSNFVTSVFRGLPERYPDLELVWQEAGVSWIPYFVWRLNNQYLSKPELVPYLEKLPSEYINEQYYFCTQDLGHPAENAQSLAKMIEIIGIENIMYSADLPHPAFDPPEELFNRIRSNFGKEDLDRIMGETAREVYGL
jgi:predicted TIM-barrel fold metal-dependent hydrolase